MGDSAEHSHEILGDAEPGFWPEFITEKSDGM